MLQFFWKCSTDFGINEQGGQLYLLNLISEQGKNLQVWWKKKSQKAKPACSFIRDFRVPNWFMTWNPSIIRLFESEILLDSIPLILLSAIAGVVNAMSHVDAGPNEQKRWFAFNDIQMPANLPIFIFCETISRKLSCCVGWVAKFQQDLKKNVVWHSIEVLGGIN